MKGKLRGNNCGETLGIPPRTPVYHLIKAMKSVIEIASPINCWKVHVFISSALIAELLLLVIFSDDQGFRKRPFSENLDSVTVYFTFGNEAVMCCFSLWSVRRSGKAKACPCPICLSVCFCNWLH